MELPQGHETAKRELSIFLQQVVQTQALSRLDGEDQVCTWAGSSRGGLSRELMAETTVWTMPMGAAGEGLRWLIVLFLSVVALMVMAAGCGSVVSAAGGGMLAGAITGRDEGGRAGARGSGPVHILLFSFGRSATAAGRTASRVPSERSRTS